MENKKWDLGTRFGHLITTGKSYNGIKSRKFVEVICDCGVIKFMRVDTLRDFENMSCGCYNIQRIKDSPPHITHGLSKHPIWNVYRGMILRCYQRSCNRWHRYGGKGVIMCDEWRNDFQSFYDWAIDKWKPGLQLDKDILYKKIHGTDTGMIYSPTYCCFITAQENSRNRSTSRFIEFNGENKTMAEWADSIGISQQTLSKRINSYKWTIERALSQDLKILKNRFKN